MELGKDILRSYFKENNLARIQIDSYNDLVLRRIPEIIRDQTLQVKVNRHCVFILEFSNVYIGSPRYLLDNQSSFMFPHEARIRDLTYETQVLADAIIHVVDTTNNIVLFQQTLSSTEIFKLPVMLHSCICNLSQNNKLQKKECILDNGGYFIIKGKERVLMAQERINYNYIYVFCDNKNAKYTHFAEIRSVKEDADYSVLTKIMLGTNHLFYCTLPYIQGDVPIGILLRALGMECLNVDTCFSKFISKSWNPYKTLTQEEALKSLSELITNHIEDIKKISYMKQTLENELLPHLGIHSSLLDKANFLCMMINKILRVFTGIRPEDDRDHICNKRIEMTGDLIANLFKAIFKQCLKNISLTVQKKQEYSILPILQRYNISQKILKCFTTGNWGVPKSNYIRQGVSQVLSRLSYIATVSHLRRVVVPIGKESKNSDVRQLHSTNFGFIDNVESPEGQAVGLVKNFALCTRISTNIDNVIIYECFYYCLSEFFTKEGIPILVNGIPFKYVQDIQSFITAFREHRNNQFIPFDVSICYDDIEQEILIVSDGGRVLRPLIQCKKEIRKELVCYKDDWNTLLSRRLIVFLDGAEIEMSVVAMSLEDDLNKYDYCEIHPSVMLGTCSGIIAFPEHSQAPRNVYISSMMKQGIGTYALNYNLRYDTGGLVLHYPQKRLVTTEMSKLTGFDEVPSGMNAIVAIACYTSYNQEDSILMNKASVDRGLFRITNYKTIVTQETKFGTHNRDSIEIPKQFRQPGYNYDYLDNDGIVMIGSKVNEGDVLVGKVYYEDEEPVRDCSIVCKANEAGIVDSVCICLNASGYQLVKIRIRREYIPEIGDKFVEISAQKGTLGNLIPQEDMPFNHQGIVPDIIMNAHAIPSRMTINALLSILCGKACSFSGEEQDATAFCHSGEDLVEKAGNVLKEKGYESLGNEMLYNGMTGKPLKAHIFMGPTYYQRLKHLVANKIHARGSTGNVQMLSRQPCAGRSRSGGLRLGEMERDALITHGTSIFLKERLFDMSDPYQIDVCKVCGTMVHYHKKCMVCNKLTVDKVNIPYACKLLFQNLQAMGIKVNIFPET